MELGTYKETTFELLPAAERRLRLLSIEQVDAKPEFIEYDEAGNPKNPYRWQWNWTVTRGPNLNAKFATWTNTNINKGSIAAGYAEALLNRKLQLNEPLREEMLVNRELDCYLSDKGTKGGAKQTIVNPRPATEEAAALAQAQTQERDLLVSYSNAKVKLIDRGIANDVINACVARVTGSEDHIASQPPDKQQAAVKHLQDWAEDTEGTKFDKDGEVLF